MAINSTSVQYRPKYIQLKTDIVNNIRSGQLQPGEKMLSERQLMSLYRVSHATVSKALKSLVEIGLVERKWGKGTYVSKRPFIAAATNIGVTADEAQATPSYMLPLMRGIGEGIDDVGIDVQLFPLRDAKIFDETLLARLLQDKLISGLIVTSPHKYEDIRRLDEMSIPVVSVRNEYSGTCTPWVREDVDSTAAQIVNYLAGQLGHRHLRIVTGPRHKHSALYMRASNIACQALLNKFREAGLRCSESSVIYSGIDKSWQSVAPQLQELLTSQDRPTALLFFDDDFAVNTIELASNLGLKVPEDLSIMGWSGIMHDSRLTNVSVPLEEMGKHAVIMLNKLICGREVQCEVLPTELLIRTTCAPVAEHI